MSEKRFRNFCCVFYQLKQLTLESLYLDNSVVFMSYIYHDRDVGKEPHYHLVVRYLNPVTMSRVKKDLEEYVEGNVFVEISKNLKASYDYLIHKNDLDKFQYKLEEIVSFGNYDVTDYQNPNDEFIEDLFSLDTLSMARKYGRDFIKNYKNYTGFRDTFKTEFFGCVD